MPVTVLGDVMGTTYCLFRKYSVYIHGQNIDPDWLEGFGFGTRIQPQLPYHWSLALIHTKCLIHISFYM